MVNPSGTLSPIGLEIPTPHQSINQSINQSIPFGQPMVRSPPPQPRPRARSHASGRSWPASKPCPSGNGQLTQLGHDAQVEPLAAEQRLAGAGHLGGPVAEKVHPRRHRPGLPAALARPLAAPSALDPHPTRSKSCKGSSRAGPRPNCSTLVSGAIPGDPWAGRWARAAPTDDRPGPAGSSIRGK